MPATTPMKSGFLPLFLASLALSLTISSCKTNSYSDYDVILTGGLVYDGTGAPGKLLDIGIVDGRIVSLGKLSNTPAVEIVDITGFSVSPGFIDIHSHAAGSDAEDSGIYKHPEAENYVRQGVTTAVAGQDGTSSYPIGDFLDTIESRNPAINFATYVGHGTVRRRIMGNEDRDPEPAELDAMKILVERAMKDGAFGLSTGLKYPPGTYSKTSEVIELAKVAGAFGGAHISHMREEGLDLLKSVEETIQIGRDGGLPTQLTHHKAIGKSMWGQSEASLRMVDEANAAGIDTSIDQYPYTASSTNLTILFPAWSLTGEQEDIVAKLRDPDQRQRIKDQIIFNLEKDRGGGNPANVAVAYCAWDTTLNGMNLASILERQGRTVNVPNAADLAMELQEKGGFQGIFHAMSEEDVVRIMQHPKTMIASDGGIPTFGQGVPHPRNYGTFARVLGKYVREDGVLTLEEALRKMTSLPADRMGLKDRGRIAEGMVADIAVFDPDSIIDQATFEKPHQYSTGVSTVLVSGEIVLLHGEMTGDRGGRVLRLVAQ